MDGFFGIGIQELILIAIVALIVLGPERLPATFREIAKFIRQVRNLTSEFTTQFGDDFKALEDLDPRRILQRELASIDEEEQVKENTAKGKTTPAKTTSTTTPKPTPAKATTPKTTTKSTTTTAKSTASTTASSTTPTVSTTTTTETLAATQADSASTAPATTLAAAPNTESQGTSAPEAENRIAPPSLTAVTQASEATVEPTIVVAPSAVPANGIPPQETESTVVGDVVPSA